MFAFSYQTRHYTLEAGGKSALLYRFVGSHEAIPIGWPEFEINGRVICAAPDELRLLERRFLNDKIEQITLAGSFGAGLTLSMELRVCAETPFVRFRYVLSSDAPAALTKENGETLCYLSYPGKPDAIRTEVRFSGYDALSHSYCLAELDAFAHEEKLIGPILTEQRGDVCMLTAYEHGSVYPDVFVAFMQTPDGIALRAVKGNYWNGQSVFQRPYETIWLQLGAVKGDTDALARAYRAFQLSYCALRNESRKPYIFYNTWAFQERNKFYNRQKYLSSMQHSRIEQEIEVAHRMGVDVFVIDTGWFSKTGDWEVDRKRFPKGMEYIRDLLAERGMKLGLWFAPTAAAVSSEMLRRFPDCYAEEGGREPQPGPVWETEDSYRMCPVSDYWEAFADRLIELARTLGVRYFKWDAVGMENCDRPGHLHGDETAGERERKESYSFNVGLYMSRIAERICDAVPDAIVDMDVTESDRYFGLGFLSSGKFFAINNGPYYHNYDISVPSDQWSNIFVTPGPARTWICRQNLSFDKWIPSVLLMAHYLPDDPQSSQMLNLASLMLGQNGIWGDLLSVSDAGVRLFGDVLGVYKTLQNDITKADPVVYGRPGETFEAHEKINSETGRGLVVLFANQPGEYKYKITSPTHGDPLVYGGAACKRTKDALWVQARFTEPGAAILFFGA